MKILVTGGAGYIGSHTCVRLLDSGHELFVIDDLSNSNSESLQRVQQLTGKSLRFFQFSLADETQLSGLFSDFDFDAVIHFAAFKAVSGSIAEPLEYYRNNVSGTLSLMKAMQTAGCKNLVFSSSATVYGQCDVQPIDESQPTTAAETPYGWTKLMSEQIMRDTFASDSDWNISLLRYFNPVGAHPSGEIGEDPNGIPNNLLPFVTKVAIGQLPKLSVFGDDYETPDGSCVRDYIHVVDLARAHVLAVEQLATDPGLVTYNLGTGQGTSVLEMVDTFQKATGVSLNFEIAPRRPGDVVVAYADPTKAQRELGWRSELNVEDMCRDGWNWQQQNPNGFPKT